MLRYQGTLVEWNDARGFGFVQAKSGGDKVFVHISAFQPKPSAQARPQLGMHLEFAVTLENGKQRAQQVTWRNVAKVVPQASVPTAQTVRVHGAGGSYVAVVLFALLFAGVSALWGVQRWVASLYGVLSLITFFAYWKDKAAAQAGRWRTPESTLHALALLGGWPGAIFAQQWLRHKSSKAKFRTIFWCTVLLNVAAFVWLHSPWASDALAMFYKA